MKRGVDTLETTRGRWEFRCEARSHRWRWRALDGDGSASAASSGSFATLRDAIDDAVDHGFNYERARVS